MNEKEYTSFGDFILAKRHERGLTINKFADAVNISYAYYCDIEKNRRNPPDMDILKKMIAALSLSEEEKEVLFDLAGKGRSQVAPDLPDYIMGNDFVRVALRIAKKKANKEDWEKFIDTLEKK